MASLKGRNLVVFNNLSQSEIWPYKTSGICLDEPYKEGTNHVLKSIVKMCI